MKFHVKILGYLYCGFGGLIAFFVLMILLFQTLESLGVTKSDPKSPGIWGALALMVLLMIPAMWFFQIGMGLLSFQAGARLWAILISPILMIGLNVILMLLKDNPHKVGVGFTVFHVTCIVLGVYTMIVLWPKWGRELFA